MQALKIIEPPIAKQFWQAKTANPGIYLVLAGKVRLLDSGNNLISTLTSGSYFGAATLFPDHNFPDYVARAAANLKIAYLPQNVIVQLPGAIDHLFHQAEQFSQLITGENKTVVQPIATKKTLQNQSNIELNQSIIPLPKKPKQRQKYFPSPTVTAGNWWRKISKRYPFFEQQSASDCGAACLVMVSRYWGKNFSINK
ncbi:MAG: peptidase C39, partial [Nostocales cyanobacterium]